MKAIRISSTVLLTALLGMTTFAYAGQEHQSDKQDHSKQNQKAHEQRKPQKDHAQQHQDRLQQRSPQNAHAQQQNAQQQDHRQQRDWAQQQDYRQQGDRAQQQDYRQQRDREQQQRSEQIRNHGDFQHSTMKRGEERRVWQEHRARNWQSDHRSWQQRGGYRGYRIPDYRYQGYFGRNHSFRIGDLPFMVEGGYPRFQYEGYWFSVLDPWPTQWGNDWYDNDDVYVGYIDNGYYLFNRRYPGMGIAINISM